MIEEWIECEDISESEVSIALTDESARDGCDPVDDPRIPMDGKVYFREIYELNVDRLDPPSFLIGINGSRWTEIRANLPYAGTCKREKLKIYYGAAEAVEA